MSYRSPPPPPQPLRPDIRAGVELVAAGSEVHDAAAQVKVTPQALASACRKAGIKPPSGKDRVARMRQRYYKKRDKAIVALWRDGKSATEIAARSDAGGLSVWGVVRVLNRDADAGLPTKRSPPVRAAPRPHLEPARKAARAWLERRGRLDQISIRQAARIFSAPVASVEHFIRILRAVDAASPVRDTASKEARRGR